MAVSGNYLFLFKNGNVVGLTYPLLTMVLICLVVTLSNYLLVERQKRFVQGADEGQPVLLQALQERQRLAVERLAAAFLNLD